MFEFMKKKKTPVDESLFGFVADPDCPTVELADPIPEAAKTAVKIKAVATETIQGELAATKALLKGLLPVESDSKPQLEHRLAELEGVRLDNMFPRIDLSFLRWRRKADGWPVFAVYSIDNPLCEIGSRQRRRRESYMVPEIEMPGGTLLDTYFDDVEERLEKIAYKDRNDWSFGSDESIISRFQGLIPNETRRKIAESRNWFNYVLIVGEAAWMRKSVPSPDPLVIGIRHHLSWLVDKFDLTSMDRIVASEFTSKENRS